MWPRRRLIWGAMVPNLYSSSWRSVSSSFIATAGPLHHRRERRCRGARYPALGDRHESGDGQTQVHGDTEGAADAAALGRLAKSGPLQVVEGALEDQLRVDPDDAALRLRRAQSGLEPANRPLSPFGEPPNVRELSGADGPEQHLGRRRPLVPAPCFRRSIHDHPMRPDRCFRLHARDAPHRHSPCHIVLPRLRGLSLDRPAHLDGDGRSHRPSIQP